MNQPEPDAVIKLADALYRAGVFQIDRDDYGFCKEVATELIEKGVVTVLETTNQ